MKIIYRESKVIRTVLGDQKVSAGAYKPSQFNFMMEEKEMLLVNTFTGMLGILEAGERELLQGSISISDANEITPQLRFLIEKRFLVPADCDESEIYRQLREIVFTMRKPKELSVFTIFTTTACNARCFYCFEADCKPITMDAKTAEDVADYIICNCSKNKIINLRWFGGEPLCNQKAMDIICGKLRDSGINFTSSATSNGFFFHGETVKKAKEAWNLGMVQITLDGMKEEHNRRKNYAMTDGDPFEITIRNIHNLLEEKIAVRVRLNFDMANLESIEKLIQFLADEFGDKPNFIAYPAMLFEDCVAWNPDRPPEEQQKLLQHLHQFRDQLENKHIGFEVTLARDLRMERCGANNRGHRDILPDGRFTVCNNIGVGDTYGSIYEGITDVEKYEKWKSLSNCAANKCKDCCWLPECTTFNLCPIRRSTCRQEEREMMERRLRNEYRRYLEMLENQPAKT